jgi:hypothetical protein
MVFQFGRCLQCDQIVFRTRLSAFSIEGPTLAITRGRREATASGFMALLALGAPCHQDLFRQAPAAHARLEARQRLTLDLVADLY